MDLHNLIDMANRIGEFFESMPDRGVARSDIANHIKLFWEPRMRRTLLDSLDKPNGVALTLIVREALEGHRTELTPMPT